MLEELRSRIDEIDRQIIVLFEDRMHTAIKIGECKLSTGKKVLDSSREQDVLQSRLDMLKDKNLLPYAQKLVQYLMDLSKDAQKSLQNPRVAYQGIKGAYAHEALLRYFGKAQQVECGEFKEVFKAVQFGAADFGIVPVENSYSGAITQNYDLLGMYGCHIIGECVLGIDHCLLGVHGAALEQVTDVYSHEQGLLQCDEFIKKYGFATHVYHNTAISAKYISDLNDKTKAAVAGRHTAQIYGLQILAQGISSQKDNYTRFIVVGNVPVDTGSKASLYFTLKHKCGSLHEALEYIAAGGYNLTAIESRPIYARQWEYCFYVDIDGITDASEFRQYIKGMCEKCGQIRILGVYDSCIL